MKISLKSKEFLKREGNDFAVRRRVFKSVLWVLLLVFAGCTEHIDTSARYVFSDPTALSYLKAHPESYSSYVDLLMKTPVSSVSKTTVGQLLSARGHYTVFAPTNEAVQNFLDSLILDPKNDFLTAPSWDAFTDSVKLDSIRRLVVHNSIIDCGDMNEAYWTYDFPTAEGAEFPLENMYDRKISISYGDTANYADSIFLNKDCAIHERNRNIPVLNGIIHQVNKCVVLSEYTAKNYLTRILEKKQEGYAVMARCIQACGLLDTLAAVRDEKYETLVKTGKLTETFDVLGTTFYLTPHRKYGFTIFAETDDFWRSQGIDPFDPDLFEKLQQWVKDNHQYSEIDQFVEDDNYQKPSNLLYQWVTYHILPMRLATDKLVFHVNEQGHYYSAPTSRGIPVEEFYVPLGHRRLLKIFESKESHGVYLNRFPNLDNGRHGTGHEISCDPSKVGCRVGNDDPRAVTADMANCNIYPLDAPLAYTDEVRDNLKARRIRLDGAMLFPELMNNDIRKKQSFDLRHQNVMFPPCDEYQYFDNMTINEGVPMGYLNNLECGYCEMNDDEFRGNGRYEIIIKMPPVSRSGIYEMRYYYHATSAKIRGMAQLYLGTNPDYLPPMDIPVSWEISPNDPITGWEPDSGDDAYDAEVERRMRNQGFMKGDNSYAVAGTNYTDRVHNWSIRRIIFRGFIDSEKTYYFKLKDVLDMEGKTFYMDYLEICPKEVYDNPVEPEDIW